MKPHPECENLDTAEHYPDVAALTMDDGEHPVPEFHIPIQRCDSCAELYARDGKPSLDGDLDAAIEVARARSYTLLGIPSPSGQPYVVNEPWESVKVGLEADGLRSERLRHREGPK